MRRLTTKTTTTKKLEDRILRRQTTSTTLDEKVQDAKTDYRDDRDTNVEEA